MMKIIKSLSVIFIIFFSGGINRFLEKKRDKKACAQLDWVAILTFNFGKNYGWFLYILGYLVSRE
jgi:hypothetical protein